MEALELDTFSCWTPLETLRLLARLAEISVSRALLPLWPLTTGSESEPLRPQLVIRAGRIPAGTALYKPGATGSVHAPPLPPFAESRPPNSCSVQRTWLLPPRYQVIDKSALGRCHTK